MLACLHALIKEHGSRADCIQIIYGDTLFFKQKVTSVDNGVE